MATTRFGNLRIRFDERVLRPRAWTLAQSRWAAELSGQVPGGPLLELFAGVGHIGLAAASMAGRDLVLVDADAHACRHARRNVADAALPVRVDVRHGPVDAVLGPGERFPLILADPPWVPSQETARYPEDPVPAIDGGADGLDVARTCLAVMGRHLGPAGAAVLQLGDEAQVARLEDHLRAHPRIGLRVVEVRRVERANGILVELRHAGQDPSVVGRPACCHAAQPPERFTTRS